jgi:hypothetical protein
LAAGRPATVRRFEEAILERRSQTRHDVCIPGEISWRGGEFRQRCTIRDLSLDGARAELTFFTEVPKKIFLLEEESGRLFDCEVRWQQGCQIGLYFLDMASRSVRRALLQKHAGQG